MDKELEIHSSIRVMKRNDHLGNGFGEIRTYHLKLSC